MVEKAKRNPVKPAMARLFNGIHGLVGRTRGESRDVEVRAAEFAEDMALETKLVDVSITFIGASNLPKMDIVGLADPFFVANVDKQISYVSSVQPTTLKPVWNESWNIMNVPQNATLTVEVMDKDEGSVHDDYIGSFTTTIYPGPREAEIISTIRKAVKGTFWLNIKVEPSQRLNFRKYLFAGPVRYTRHFSPAVGRLTAINDERLYSTWKISLKGVPHFFNDTFQHWNTEYKAAQTIFGTGPTSLAVRSSIRSGHRLLYARSTRDGYGIIETPTEVLNLLCGGKGSSNGRVKPAVYTYIIDSSEDSLRFSETGAAFFVDFASKHALHANCAETVRYSGEFHPRPVVKNPEIGSGEEEQVGWEYMHDELKDEDVAWEIVVDNNSGTYSPDHALLPNLKELLEFNFPGLRFVALDRLDPELEKSREACRAYATQRRGIKEDELQPHMHQEGEETLMQHAAAHTPMDERPEEQIPLRQDSLASVASVGGDAGALGQSITKAQIGLEASPANDGKQEQLQRSMQEMTTNNNSTPAQLQQPTYSQRIDEEFTAFMNKK